MYRSKTNKILSKSSKALMALVFAASSLGVAKLTSYADATAPDSGYLVKDVKLDEAKKSQKILEETKGNWPKWSEITEDKIKGVLLGEEFADSDWQAWLRGDDNVKDTTENRNAAFKAAAYEIARRYYQFDPEEITADDVAQYLQNPTAGIWYFAYDQESSTDKWKRALNDFDFWPKKTTTDVDWEVFDAQGDDSAQNVSLTTIGELMYGAADPVQQGSNATYRYDRVVKPASAFSLMVSYLRGTLLPPTVSSTHINGDKQDVADRLSQSVMLSDNSNPTVTVVSEEESPLAYLAEVQFSYDHIGYVLLNQDNPMASDSSSNANSISLINGFVEGAATDADVKWYSEVITADGDTTLFPVTELGRDTLVLWAEVDGSRFPVYFFYRNEVDCYPVLKDGVKGVASGDTFNEKCDLVYRPSLGFIKSMSGKEVDFTGAFADQIEAALTALNGTESETVINASRLLSLLFDGEISWKTKWADDVTCNLYDKEFRKQTVKGSDTIENSFLIDVAISDKDAATIASYAKTTTWKSVSAIAEKLLEAIGDEDISTYIVAAIEKLSTVKTNVVENILGAMAAIADSMKAGAVLLPANGALFSVLMGGGTLVPVGSDDAEKISDETNSVRLSGANVTADTTVSVETKDVAELDDAEFVTSGLDTLGLSKSQLEAILYYDITSNTEDLGEVSLDIAVDPKYNGQKLYVIHSAKDGVEVFEVVAKDGWITVRPNGLSPFAVYALKDQTSSEEDETKSAGKTENGEETGDTSTTGTGSETGSGSTSGSTSASGSSSASKDGTKSGTGAKTGASIQIILSTLGILIVGSAVVFLQRKKILAA